MLNEKDILDIQRLYWRGVPVWKIAEQFNITEAYVVKICRDG